MNHGKIYSIIIGTCFLFLFGVAEFLYHKVGVKVEFTRKFVHISAGLLVLLFPFMFDSHWYVLILCILFFSILLLSLRFGKLPSINAIDRISRGSLLYPLSVYGCFLAFERVGYNVQIFYIPILLMAVCDALAALIGKVWPVGKYCIGKTPKTLIGSFTFLCSAFLLSGLMLREPGVAGFWHANTWSVAAIIAITTTGLEAVSNKGYDNLTVPGSALLILLLT